MHKNFIFFLIIITSFIANAETEDYTALEQRINQLTYKIEQLEHNNAVLEKKIESLTKAPGKKQTEDIVETEAEERKVNSIKKTSGAKEEFEIALSALKEQNYKEAEALFTKFVKNHPKSEYTGESYYWLGESFALRKKYDKAAVNYIMSFNKFPKNSKADLSMLKLVSALNSLGKNKEACSTLAKLEAKKKSLDSTTQKLLLREMKKASCK